MTDFPVVITRAGLVPATPAALRALLIALVEAVVPGYTADLPGSLIEDVASTDVGALTVCDAAKVDLVNSLTPYGANAFLLNQLGQMYGVQQGTDTNTSVLAVFSGPAGFIISVGFTISDGVHQYTVQDGAVIGGAGLTNQLFCLATLPGSWVVPAGSVNQVITGLPNGVTVTVTNPLAGVPSEGEQSEEDYRAEVIQAGLATSSGVPTMLKTILGRVPGVQQRLISVRSPAANQWEVIAGGGDPYQVAYAIYTAVLDVSTLVGSTLSVTGITNANPGVVTTDLNHGYSSGQVVAIAGVVGTSGVNGSRTITVVDEKSFSIGVDTTSSGAYVSGGVVTPNFRNQVVSLNDYPDAYSIPYVTPPQQTVAVDVTWDTSSPNFVSPDSVAALGGPALVAYINSIPVGVPINLFELQNAFQVAVSALIPVPLLTRMIFVVSINGVVTAPESGTGIIAGDPESYFETDVTQMTIAQG